MWCCKKQVRYYRWTQCVCGGTNGLLECFRTVLGAVAMVDNALALGTGGHEFWLDRHQV